MPPWPMAMPSSMAMVLNSLAMPPAFSISPRHQLAQVVQVDMAGTNWVKLLAMAMMGLPKSASFHAGGAPQRAGAGHIAAVGGGAGTVCGHSGNPVADAAKGILCGGLADRARAASRGLDIRAGACRPGKLLFSALFWGLRPLPANGFHPAWASAQPAVIFCWRICCCGCSQQ